MPCNSDYLAATPQEVAASQVECFFDELDGLAVDEGWRRGYHPRSYNQSDKKSLDRRVEALCARIKREKTDLKKFSLEFQIWWRDHQLADEIRLRTEADKSEIATTRALALAKLTPEERKALGV